MRRSLLASCVASVLVACAAFSGESEGGSPTGGVAEAGADGASVDAGAPTDGALPPDAAEAPQVVLAAGQAGATSIVATSQGPVWGITVGEAGLLRRAEASGAVDLVSYGGGRPSRVVLDGTRLVWGDLGVQKGLRALATAAPLYDEAVEAFASVPKGFLAIREVPKEQSPDGGFDARFLLWTNGVLQVTGHGTYPSRLWDVVADGDIALVTRDDGTILSFSPANPQAAPTPYVGPEPGCRNLAVNDAGVYWTRFSQGTVRMRDRTGSLRTLATDQVTPFGLAADASGVYWLTGDGALRRWNGTQVVTLASTLALASADGASRHHPLALTPDAVVLLTATEVLQVKKGP